jgi:hypothetical protein
MLVVHNAPGIGLILAGVESTRIYNYRGAESGNLQNRERFAGLPFFRKRKLENFPGLFPATTTGAGTGCFASQLRQVTHALIHC